MKKLLSFCIIGMLVFCVLIAAAQGTKQPQQNTLPPQTTAIIYVDELDQYMTSYGGYIPVGAYQINQANHINVTIAQSFIPQKEVITNVDFLMAKNSSASNACVLTLKDNLTGQDITSVQVNPEQFTNLDPDDPQASFTWVSFDIPDTCVTSGETYFLVLSTANTTGNLYYCAGNDSNFYLNGTAYLSTDNGITWTDTNADGCFKTYGLEETFLEVTMNGGSFGPSYTIKNIGNYTAWDVNFNFTISGGFILLGRHFTTTRSELPPGEEMIVRGGLILGFGKVIISIKVSAANVREISSQTDATIILFFIVGIQ